MPSVARELSKQPRLKHLLGSDAYAGLEANVPEVRAELQCHNRGFLDCQPYLRSDIFPTKTNTDNTKTHSFPAIALILLVIQPSLSLTLNTSHSGREDSGQEKYRICTRE